MVIEMPPGQPYNQKPKMKKKKKKSIMKKKK
jgi:hypothetical protein